MNEATSIRIRMTEPILSQTSYRVSFIRASWCGGVCATAALYRRARVEMTEARAAGPSRALTPLRFGRYTKGKEAAKTSPAGPATRGLSWYPARRSDATHPHRPLDRARKIIIL